MAHHGHEHPPMPMCMGMQGPKVPVTILTGFLGAGKTTLMNYILQSPDHKMKFAIIENEYGDTNIDADLVATKENITGDSIVEMMNGCICCTVRGDMLQVINRLLARKDEFDGILIETTGMADPAPVVQTFLLDPGLARQTEIDGVVAVVDAKHVVSHLHEVKEEGAVNETQQQIAFADKIILNKIDLVTDEEKAEARMEIRTINQTAEIIEAENSKVEPKTLIGMKSFDLSRIMEFDPELLTEPEPEEVEPDCCDKDTGKCNASAPAKTDDCCDMDTGKCSSSKTVKTCGSEKKSTCASKEKKACGSSEKKSSCSSKKKVTPRKKKHDSRISSISFEQEEDIDITKLQQKLGHLVQTKPENLYRYKGVVSVMGKDEKFVFQGVHMLLKADFMEQCWKPDEKRVSKLVFIGKDLNKDDLTALFNDCKADPLRFKIGTRVEANCGSWLPGKIIMLWDEGNAYRILLDDGSEMWAPLDTDGFCRELQN